MCVVLVSMSECVCSCVCGRFTLIRVRFHDGSIIQGKFRPSDKVAAVKMWVDACLCTPDRCLNLYGPLKLLAYRAFRPEAPSVRGAVKMWVDACPLYARQVS